MIVEHTWHVLLKQIVNVQANVGATSVKIDDLKNILFQDYTQGNPEILMNATDLNNSISYFSSKGKLI